MPRPEPWNIADLLDFEFLLEADAQAADHVLEQRDRVWREHASGTIRGDEALDRRTVFKRWVNARREARDLALPGEHFVAGWQTLLTICAVLGLLIGASLTGGLLYYRGAEPVNVAWFFACTVGVQLAVLATAVLIGLLRRIAGGFDQFRPLLWILSGLTWASSAGLRRLPGESRNQIRAGWALLSHKREIYGSLTVWPFVIATQLFGICFNLAVIGTLLLHVSLSDVGFGWQSTLHTSAAEAHRIVSAVSAPWSWLPNSHPTLAQVEASRFAYSEGIRPLSREAMAAWWPWLCYSVVFYGLLVRVALFGWASIRLRRGASRITFEDRSANALWRRLTNPIIQAQSGTAVLHVPDAVPEPLHRASGRCLVLVSADVALDEARASAMLKSHFGWEVAKFLPVQIDHPSGNPGALEELAQRAPELVSVAVVARAKRPPIKAISLLIQKVAAAATPKVEVIILLVGRSEGDSFAPVEDEHFAHWRNFNSIHGLHVGLEKWRPA